MLLRKRTDEANSVQIAFNVILQTDQNEHLNTIKVKDFDGGVEILFLSHKYCSMFLICKRNRGRGVGRGDMRVGLERTHLSP